MHLTPLWDKGDKVQGWHDKVARAAVLDLRAPKIAVTTGLAPVGPGPARRDGQRCGTPRRRHRSSRRPGRRLRGGLRHRSSRGRRLSRPPTRGRSRRRLPPRRPAAVSSPAYPERARRAPGRPAGPAAQQPVSRSSRSSRSSRTPQPQPVQAQQPVQSQPVQQVQPQTPGSAWPSKTWPAAQEPAAPPAQPVAPATRPELPPQQHPESRPTRPVSFPVDGAPQAPAQAEESWEATRMQAPSLVPAAVVTVVLELESGARQVDRRTRAGGPQPAGRRRFADHPRADRRPDAVGVEEPRRDGRRPRRALADRPRLHERHGRLGPWPLTAGRGARRARARADGFHHPRR